MSNTIEFMARIGVLTDQDERCYVCQAKVQLFCGLCSECLACDPFLRNEPLTSEALKQLRHSIIEHAKAFLHIDHDVEMTCDGCDLAPICTFSFDPYNTQGNCLLSK